MPLRQPNLRLPLARHPHRHWPRLARHHHRRPRHHPLKPPRRPLQPMPQSHNQPSISRHPQHPRRNQPRQPRHNQPKPPRQLRRRNVLGGKGSCKHGSFNNQFQTPLQANKHPPNATPPPGPVTARRSRGAPGEQRLIEVTIEHETENQCVMRWAEQTPISKSPGLTRLPAVQVRPPPPAAASQSSP